MRVVLLAVAAGVEVGVNSFGSLSLRIDGLDEPTSADGTTQLSSSGAGTEAIDAAALLAKEAKMKKEWQYATGPLGHAEFLGAHSPVVARFKDYWWSRLEGEDGWNVVMQKDGIIKGPVNCRQALKDAIHDWVSPENGNVVCHMSELKAGDDEYRYLCRLDKTPFYSEYMGSEEQEHCLDLYPDVLSSISNAPNRLIIEGTIDIYEGCSKDQNLFEKEKSKAEPAAAEASAFLETIATEGSHKTSREDMLADPEKKDITGSAEGTFSGTLTTEDGDVDVEGPANGTMTVSVPKNSACENEANDDIQNIPSLSGLFKNEDVQAKVSCKGRSSTAQTEIEEGWQGTVEKITNKEIWIKFDQLIDQTDGDDDDGVRRFCRSQYETDFQVIKDVEEAESPVVKRAHEVFAPIPIELITQVKSENEGKDDDLWQCLLANGNYNKESKLARGVNPVKYAFRHWWETTMFNNAEWKEIKRVKPSCTVRLDRGLSELMPTMSMRGSADKDDFSNPFVCETMKWKSDKFACDLRSLPVASDCHQVEEEVEELTATSAAVMKEYKLDMSKLPSQIIAAGKMRMIDREEKCEMPPPEAEFVSTFTTRDGNGEDAEAAGTGEAEESVTPATGDEK